MVLDCSVISSEPCAFVDSSHECTASVALGIWVLGRELFTKFRDQIFSY
ncbi:hypothetical protein SLEP1_g6656 [Rubroshorea leprosula]|uniref:Uncharacterized protein n=1 Tax=Rubroshorea leprosula TaxID=152421 RepID=A0AAV5I464_9ROSI|nr:hypothetical protein SLEP1_g6656 [Rubroshorea leprosula]